MAVGAVLLLEGLPVADVVVAEGREGCGDRGEGEVGSNFLLKSRASLAICNVVRHQFTNKYTGMQFFLKHKVIIIMDPGLMWGEPRDHPKTRKV